MSGSIPVLGYEKTNRTGYRLPSYIYPLCFPFCKISFSLSLTIHLYSFGIIICPSWLTIYLWVFSQRNCHNILLNACQRRLLMGFCSLNCRKSFQSVTPCFGTVCHGKIDNKLKTGINNHPASSVGMMCG